MATPSCDFCGISTKHCDGVMIKVRECKNDTTSYLKTLNLDAKTDLPEHDLILSRVRSQEEAAMTLDSIVCAYHRSEFGTRWKRKKRTCQYPSHKGKGSISRSINFEMHYELLEMHGKAPAVADGICRKCRGEHAELYANFKLEVNASQTSTEPSMLSSQVSNWSEERTVTLEEINKALDVLTTAAQCDKIHLDSRLSKDWETLSPRTRFQYKCKLKDLVSLVHTLVAPGQEERISSALEDYSASDAEGSEEDKLLSTIISLFQRADEWKERRQLLSLICDNHSKSELMAKIDGLTKWEIDAARQHAAKHGEGSAVKSKAITRNRLEEGKVDHFIDFLADPVYLKVASFGNIDIKLSEGDVIHMPNVKRTLQACHLVDPYQRYCKEVEFEPLSRSSLFRLLNVCEASYTKSMQGLDNIMAAGIEAFDHVNSIIHQLQEAGMSAEWSREQRQTSDAFQLYLKSDFKMHLELHSPVPDHCLQHCLSDPEHGSFAVECDEGHDKSCELCDLFYRLCDSLQEAVVKLPEVLHDLKEELDHELTDALTKIRDWRGHIVRCVNQDRSRTKAIDSLDTNQGLLVLDWAMKFVPIHFRESQKDWFAKKGRNWHVSVLIHKDQQDNLRMRTFVHLFESVKQDWQAIGAIILNDCETIREQLPWVEKLVIRSDNAGCYKNAALINLIPSIEKASGLEIDRYDFSEAQDGKGACDRKIGPLRKRIHRFVDEGHNVESAKDMKVAIDHDGGLKSVQAAVVKMEESTNLKTPKWPGIQQLNNFRFSEDKITAWKAYDIGNGEEKTIDKGHPVELKRLTVVEGFSTPREVAGVAVGKRAQTGSEKEEIYPCVEDDCSFTATSFSDLEDHVSLGLHHTQHTPYDRIALKWADKVESLSAHTKAVLQAGSTKDTPSEASKGCALKTTKPRKAHSQKVLKHLRKLFDEGALTGRKKEPADVARDMKSMRGPDGNKVFQATEWLSPLQITSVFSRLAAQSRMGTLSTLDHSDSTDETDDILLQRNIEERTTARSVLPR